MSDSKAGFITVETYGPIHKKPKKGKKGRKIPGVRSARAILAEGDRAFASTPHIQHPLPPVLCYGERPLELVPEIENIMREGRSKSGRKLRKDSRILGAGVAGFPYTVDEVATSERLQEELHRWIELVIRFLKKQWRSELRCVVLHTDEPYPHLHFYTLARMQDGVVMHDDLHPGKRASYAARQNVGGEDILMKALREIYKNGLRDFQHDYYVEVSAPLGHARYKDQEQRIPYSQVQSVRAQEKGLGAAWRNLREEEEKHAVRSRQLEDDLQAFLADRHALEIEKDEFDRDRAALLQEREDLTKWAQWAKENGVPVPTALEAFLSPME